MPERCGAVRELHAVICWLRAGAPADYFRHRRSVSGVLPYTVVLLTRHYGIAINKQLTVLILRTYYVPYQAIRRIRGSVLTTMKVICGVVILE